MAEKGKDCDVYVLGSGRTQKLKDYILDINKDLIWQKYGGFMKIMSLAARTFTLLFRPDYVFSTGRHIDERFIEK